MTLEKLFKMIENANKLNSLLETEQRCLHIRTWEFGNFESFTNVKGFKKWAKEDYDKEYIYQFLNEELVQDERCKAEFNGQDGFCIVVH